MNMLSLMRRAAGGALLLASLTTSAPGLAQNSSDDLFRRGMEAGIIASRIPDGVRRDLLLEEAEAAFQSILVAQPGLHRPRLELARVLFLQGEDRLAREHFERVLADDPPAPVAANINRFLAEIRARRRWSAYFGFSLAPDSNLSGASDDNRFVWRGNPFGIEEGWRSDQTVDSGTGVRFWLGGEYQHPLGEEWRLRLGGDFRRTEYKERDFDSMDVSVHVGPRWLISPRSEASLLATGRQHWSAGDPRYYDLGLRVEARHTLTARTRLRARASWAQRDFDGRDDLDGPITDLTLGLNHILTPTLRADASIGVSREKPENYCSRRDGVRLNAGLTALLPKGFTVGVSAGWERTDWKTPGSLPNNVLDGSNREDETRRLRLSAHRRDFTIAGFSPELAVNVEERDSNAQLSDFDRVSGELSFVRPF